jgi:putative DNA primase/helicase
VLAADNTENGLSISSEEGQRAIDPLLSDVDLVIFDNLSTLCTNGSESAGDAWAPMQNWLLKLRRRGIAVLLVHHAGTNGRQRGTSRREDALDTVIGLAQPEDYSPEQGARFEVHFEKLRNRIDGDGAVAFGAKLESISVGENDCVRWLDCDLRPPILNQAAALFQAISNPSTWRQRNRPRRSAPGPFGGRLLVQVRLVDRQSPQADATG